MAEKNTGGVAVVDEWLEADGLMLIESWARDGYTVQDIATRIGVVQQTLRAWMNKYPEIKQAVNNGRELVDYKVENALLKAALGYKTKEVRVATIIRNGKTIETQKETIEKEQAPNVSACQAWLYNRKPKVWKNMNSRANILDDIGEETSIHITVERATAPEGKNNESAVGSSSFEEVDTDWQNDVNKEVVVRGMTQEEKAEARRKQQQAKKEQEEQEKFLLGDKSAAVKNGSKKQSKRAFNASVKGGAKDTKCAHDTDDPDYWPDDWEDDDGQEEE